MPRYVELISVALNAAGSQVTYGVFSGSSSVSVNMCYEMMSGKIQLGATTSR